MTTNDWVGLIVTVVIFFLMLGMYVWVLRPKNRDKLEAHKHIVLDEDKIDSGGKNG